MRLSEGYRLYAAPGDDFLQRSAAQLQAYAEDIERQQAAPALPHGVHPIRTTLWSAAGDATDDVTDVVVLTFRSSATGR